MVRVTRATRCSVDACELHRHPRRAVGDRGAQHGVECVEDDAVVSADRRSERPEVGVEPGIPGRHERGLHVRARRALAERFDGELGLERHAAGCYRPAGGGQQ